MGGFNVMCLAAGDTARLGTYPGEVPTITDRFAHSFSSRPKPLEGMIRSREAFRTMRDGEEVHALVPSIVDVAIKQFIFLLSRVASPRPNAPLLSG
jgi:hypothetical protein